MAYYPSIKPDELPSDLPQRSCNGIKDNGEDFSIAKSQTIKSAICGWAPSNAKKALPVFVCVGCGESRGA